MLDTREGINLIYIAKKEYTIANHIITIVVWHGVYSAMYVMQDPHVSPGDQIVSSITIMRPELEISFEFGWCAHNDSTYGNNIERPFLQRDDLDAPPKVEHFSSSYLSPGTNYAFKIRSVLGTHDWSVYLNDQLLHTSPKLDFVYGQAIAQAERHSTGTSNYGHYYHLKAMDASGGWYSWADTRGTDTDPTYDYDERSNTEFYSD